MTVAIVIPKDYQPHQYVAWARCIAEAKKQPLLVLDVQRSRQQEITTIEWEKSDREFDEGQAVFASALRLELTKGGEGKPRRSKDPAASTTIGEFIDESSPDDTVSEETIVSRIPCQLVQIRHANPIEATLETINKFDVELLVLPRYRGVKGSARDFELQRELFFQADCTTLQLCLGLVTPHECRRILVPTRGSRNTADAIRLATDLAELCNGHVDALYVQENFDDAAAELGERMIQRLVDDYADDDGSRVVTRSLVSDDIVSGIQQHAETECDLLVLGASYHSIIHRLLFSSITEQIVAADMRPTTIVIRPRAPWSRRILEVCERAVGDVVPQLDRQRRVDLVEKVHHSSRWDIDFVALICLSTLIAGLGLIQNSTAVVIGAMLLAPLMTPLLGAGLALVQGNRLLASCAAGAVTRGFLVAFAIGFLLGWVTQLESATPEMLSRCSPGVSDLVVAFASGLVAAYANGRPNLISALPGVAIAAALVPPIATAGLVFAMGRFELAFGASLLFLTNIVAIILGAACSLWAVGIRSTHAHSFVSSWSSRAIVALAIIAAGLGIYEYTSPVELPASLRREIVQRVKQERGARVLDIKLSRSESGQELSLTLASPNQVNQELLAALADTVSENLNVPTRIRLETRLEQYFEAAKQSAD